MDERPSGCGTRTIGGCLLILVVMSACIGTIFLGADSFCYAALTTKAPMYPGARATFEQHNMFRAFGMGTTLMILDSDDEPTVVRNWYGKTVGGALRQAQQQGGTGNPMFYIANGRYNIAHAEDGSGTQIILNGVCGG